MRTNTLTGRGKCTSNFLPTLVTGKSDFPLSFVLELVPFGLVVFLFHRKNEKYQLKKAYLSENRLNINQNISGGVKKYFQWKINNKKKRFSFVVCEIEINREEKEKNVLGDGRDCRQQSRAICIISA